MRPWGEYAPELVTDLYELTMAASYLEEGMSGEATFSLFIRDYPEFRSYFVSAGLEHLIELLSDLRFDEDSLEYIASLGRFSPRFIEYLRDFRFTGSVRAIPEGRIFFCEEPLLEVTGPIIEAQIVETLALNVVQIETMVASKAARVVHAARGKGLIDFGMRRAQGVDAAVKAARASYISGFLGSSNLLAGKIHGVPVFGTMAHSYVTSFEREMDAFLAFAKAFPDNTVLLIDTYDTIAGAKKAVQAAKIMAAQGKKLLAVRLDSGDMAELSGRVRLILDEAGLRDVKIMASGNLDEFRLDALIAKGAAIDLYAVGTKLCVSADAPYLDIVYKLVEYDGRPILKLSSGKKTWIGKKQVYRHYDAGGTMDHDRLCLAGRGDSGGEPLLEVVMEGGKPVRPREPVETIRARFAGEWQKLPERIRDTGAEEKYRVEISETLREMDDRISQEKRRAEVDGVLGI
ncbi:MAG: nicotinate phosphoribosyltransferase [Syntrophobacteraceae bacterium]